MAKSLYEYRQDEQKRRENALRNYMTESASSVNKEGAKASSGFNLGDYFADFNQYTRAGGLIGGLAGLTKPLWYDKLSEEGRQRLDNYVDGVTFVPRKLSEGAIKKIEGVVDVGLQATPLYMIAAAANDDVRDSIKDFVERDFVGEWYDRDAYKHREDALLKEDGNVAQLAEGVGGMLPSVVVALATGGGSLAAQGASKLPQVLSLLTTATGAAGNATESAYKDGADYYSGLAYGAAIGGLEAATDKLVGGAFKGIQGAGLLDDIIPVGNWAKTGIGRYAANAVGEGFEEMTSEALAPHAKVIYKGKDAYADYDLGDHIKDIGKAGLMGAAISGIYGGAFDAIGGGVKQGDIQNVISDMESIREQSDKLKVKNNFTAEYGKKVDSQTLGDLRIIEKTLKGVDENKRADLINKNGLSGLFETDGSLKADYAEALSKESEFDRRYFDEEYRAHESVIKSDLAELNSELEDHFGENAKKVSVYSGELTQKGKAAYTKLQRAQKIFNELNGRHNGIIVTDESPNFNGKLVGDSRIYISVDTLESGAWAGTLVHENMHFAEGTEEYNRLVSLLEADTELEAKAVEAVMNKSGYGFDKATLDIIGKRISAGENVEQGARLAYELYRSEISAHMGEAMLGTEAFINRVVRTDAPLAEKIIGKILDLKEAFGRIGDTEAQAQHKRLAEAERMYLDAIEAAGKKFENGKIVSADDEDEEKEKTVTSMSGENMRVSGDEYLYSTYGDEFYKNSKIYTYDFLSHQAPMNILKLPALSEIFTDGKIDRENIITKGKENAKAQEDSHIGNDDVVYVKNRYTQKMIEINNQSIRHGLGGKRNYMMTNSRLGLIIGDIVKNGIPINELSPSEGAESTYAIISYAVSPENKEFLAIAHIDIKSGKLVDYDTVDTVHSLRGRIKRESTAAIKSALGTSNDVSPIGTFVISIPQLLEFVNSVQQGILSDDVLKTLGENRSSEGFYVGKVKFSFKEDPSNNEKVGESVEKTVDNNKKPTSYTKAEAAEMVSGILTEFFSAPEYAGKIKNMSDAVKMAMSTLNGAEAGKRLGPAQKLADYIIAHTVLTDTVDEWRLEPFARRLEQLKPYLHRLNLESIKEDIMHHYDKDRSPFARWAVKKGERGLGVDVMAQELEADGFPLVATNPADMFIEIDSEYLAAREAFKKNADMAVKEAYSEEELKDLRQKITQEIMRHYDDRDVSFSSMMNTVKSATAEAERLRAANAKLRKEAWRQSKVAERAIAEKNEAKEKAEKERERRIFSEEYNKHASTVVGLVERIGEWKKGVFESAADANGDVFKGIIGSLTSIKRGKQLLPIKTREAMKKLADWYGAADIYPIVQELKDAEIWSAEAHAAMMAIGDPKFIETQTPLSVAELKNVVLVLRHLKHITETYHRVFRNGKYIDARELAAEYLNIIGENTKVSVGRVAKLIDSKYYEYFGDAEALMKWHDRYAEGGFFTETFNELREGALKMAIAQMEMRAELDAWLDKNHNFLKNITNKTIEVEGVEMTRAEALSLYMTARREHAEGGLAVGGFEIKNAKSGEKIGVDGLVDREMSQYLQPNDQDTKKIVLGMSDAHRYQVLKNRYISLSATVDNDKLSAIQKKLSISEKDIEFSKYGDRVRLFKKLGDEFSVFHEYSNRDIQLSFSFSKEKMRESVSKQRQDYTKLAKMLTCLDTVIENAVGIEVHNRNAEGYKSDDSLKNMYVLASAFTDGTEIVPVKLEVKEFNDKENTLHVAIALESIKADEIVKQEDAKGVAQQYSPSSAEMDGIVKQEDAKGVARQYSPPSDISIAEYFKKINPKDESFYKYIPKQFLESDVGISAETANVEYDMEKMIGLVGKFKDSLFAQFNDDEKTYLGFVEKILNEDCKLRKERTDNIRLGYSNTLEGFYYPIRRGHVATKVGDDTLGAELGRIRNLSFNQDTVIGSKGKLFIEPINNVVDRHIAGIAMYENISIAIDNFNRLFNVDISGNKNNPMTIAKAMEKKGGWAEGGKYIDKLIKDIEGINTADKYEAKALAFIRSGFAKFQLGANPKTWVTQLSSLFAASSMLDPKYMAQAMVSKTSDKASGAELDKYSPLAKLRNNENTSALAEGVMDKISGFGDVLMKPIGMTDRFVIKKLWYACQLQVEAEQKLELGSNDNKVAAAKLLEKVIFETQQNSLLTERSAAMRSNSELIKGLTMFSSDAMKVTARIVDAYGRVCVISDKLKRAEGDAKKTLETERVDAIKEFKRATGAAVSTAIFMSLVALAFSHLYGKRDDDETLGEKAKTFGADFAGNLIGGLPLVRDIYSLITDGYELNHYALSAVSDLVTGINGLFTLSGSLLSGKDVSLQDITSKTKAALFGVGQIFGIPLRNMYNVGRGVFGLGGWLTGNGKSFGYTWDSVFYDKSYQSDLNKAIAAGDDKLAARIASLIVGESFDGVDKAVSKEIRTLAEGGHIALPRAVGDSITYDGEEYRFTLRQRNRFERIYGTADEVLADLVKLKQYRDADDEVKAKAIKYVYDVYYNLAIDDMLGVDSSEKNVLFAEAIDIEKLAIIVAQARMFTADTGKDGTAISGSKKRKVINYIESLSLTAAQKYMIFGYLGYSNTNGESQVKAYINRLKLTGAEKKTLLKYSGYAA